MDQRRSLKELNLLAKNYSAEQISEMLEIDISEVENIIEKIQNEKTAEG